jgi:hypothetical protein
VQSRGVQRTKVQKIGVQKRVLPVSAGGTRSTFLMAECRGCTSSACFTSMRCLFTGAPSFLFAGITPDPTPPASPTTCDCALAAASLCCRGFLHPRESRVCSPVRRLGAWIVCSFLMRRILYGVVALKAWTLFVMHRVIHGGVGVGVGVGVRNLCRR